MTGYESDILGDLFPAHAQAAFLKQARIKRDWPDPEETRRPDPSVANRHRGMARTNRSTRHRIRVNARANTTTIGESMKVYHGTRANAGNTVFVTNGSDQYALDPRLDLRKHSVDGFQWGYAGSGPAQLALALTADALGDDDRARQVYQRFKFAVVGSLTSDTWTLTEDQIRATVADIERAQARVAGSPSDGRAADGRSR